MMAAIHGIFPVQIQVITALCFFFVLAACGPTYKTVEVAETPTKSASSNESEAFDSTEPRSDAPPAAVPLEGFKRIEWKALRGLEVKTGKTTSDLAALVGANVKLSGFMVPFDDDVEEVTEFLLVPQAGMCIHTPPPPPNQIVLVEVSNGSANRVEWDKEVQVYGQFQIADGNSPYGKTGFKISAVRARAD